MSSSGIYQLFNASGEQMIWSALWVGLALLTVILLVLMRTRWGQSQPLRKCAFISIMAHLLLAGYATTVKIVAVSSASPEAPAVVVRTVDRSMVATEAEQATEKPAKPWERVVENNAVSPEPDPFERDEAPPVEAVERETPELENKLADTMPLGEVPLAETEAPKPGEMVADTPRPNEAATDVGAELEAPVAQQQAAPEDPLPEMTPLPQRSTLPLPNLPAPQRIVRSEDSLLESASPLPRISDRATTTESAPSAEALVDEMQNTSRPEPSLPAPSESAPEDAVVSDSKTTNPSDSSAVASSETSPQPPSGMTNTPATQPEVGITSKYQLRTAANRVQQAMLRGATPESEDAVALALAWLAKQQEPDGRWDASRQLAGREQSVAGHNRGGAGADADTGITALALLAFLGAGHTQHAGDHKDTVAAALKYLKSQQGADGNLGGGARNFAFMYCHGMAALAVSEAYGMTKDPELEPVVRGAIQYSLAAQHPQTGGWRYRPWQHRPSDGGDASQMGWQLMALTSADLAGIKLPQTARDGMVNFLKRVSVGTHGGQACYRPGEQVSHTMTAEALYCRQLLGMARDNPASDEAGQFLMGELPGMGRQNLYYWYYGTLAMYQLGGNEWDRWNEALQKTLVPAQTTVGQDAGSWSANTVWGGYGGRIYSTAMSALCLEVYYRYLPVYGERVVSKPGDGNAGAGNSTSRNSVK